MLLQLRQKSRGVDGLARAIADPVPKSAPFRSPPVQRGRSTLGLWRPRQIMESRSRDLRFIAIGTSAVGGEDLRDLPTPQVEQRVQSIHVNFRAVIGESGSERRNH